jgi:hypothetical protein
LLVIRRKSKEDNKRQKHSINEVIPIITGCGIMTVAISKKFKGDQYST